MKALVTQLDHQVALGMSKSKSPFLLVLMTFFTESAVTRVWFSVAGGLWALNLLRINVFPQQQLLLLTMLPSLLVWIIGAPIKRLIGRARPYEVAHLPMSKIPARFSMDSMPSSHSSSAFAWAFTLYSLGYPASWAFLLWATLVSISRVYLGIHFLSDVLVGMFFALLFSKLYLVFYYL